MDTAIETFNRHSLHESTTVLHQPGMNLNREEDRLQTFISWPVVNVSPAELARWGFFYAGSGDVVRCYFCKIELGNWEETDVVSQEHLRWSRFCPLMRKLPTNNVPLDPNFLNQLVDVVPDVTGTNDEPEWSTISEASSQREAYLNEIQNTASLVEPDSIPIYRPKFPNFQIEKERLSSFKEWPKSMKQTPEQMADAGFFYTGKSDVVQCFCCGGSLRDWLSEDDPWTEHAINFSGCAYLNLLKSADFIKECQKDKIAKDNSKEQAEAVVSEPNEASDDGDDDDKICKLCYSKPYDTVFIPCGHVVACGKCASSTTKCPMCNERYTNILRIYLP